MNVQKLTHISRQGKEGWEHPHMVPGSCENKAGPFSGGQDGPFNTWPSHLLYGPGEEWLSLCVRIPKGLHVIILNCLTLCSLTLLPTCRKWVSRLMKILLCRSKTNEVVLTNMSLNGSKTQTALNRTLEINTGSLLFTPSSFGTALESTNGKPDMKGSLILIWNLFQTLKEGLQLWLRRYEALLLLQRT